MIGIKARIIEKDLSTNTFYSTDPNTILGKGLNVKQKKIFQISFLHVPSLAICQHPASHSAAETVKSFSIFETILSCNHCNFFLVYVAVTLNVIVSSWGKLLVDRKALHNSADCQI